MRRVEGITVTQRFFLARNNTHSRTHRCFPYLAVEVSGASIKCSTSHRANLTGI